MLAVLFLARTAMAIQFQSVATLSPVYADRFGVTLADIGFLVGLYLLPGLVIALPGGALGRRFGDGRAIRAGMVLMCLGALVMAALPAWEAQMAGRLLAGIGGVILNVLMTKLVADHFAGREIATAMGIFVNSWPVGIATALLALPLLAGPHDPTGGWSVLAIVTLGLVLFAWGVRAPTPAGSEAPVTPAPLSRRARTCVLLAGAAWGLYNGALGMVFAFGPALLAERGWTLAAASGSTSIVLWLVALTLPAGGLIADRLSAPGAVLAVGLAGFALSLAAVPLAPGQAIPVFVLIGLFAGLPAGPIMALPAAVLTPGTRALGMGLFFTLFYAGVVGAPILAGALSDHAGTAAAAFWLGSALTAGAAGAVLAFARLRPDGPRSPGARAARPRPEAPRG